MFILNYENNFGKKFTRMENIVLVCMCMHCQLCLTLLQPCGLPCQASLSLEFSRQEYLSGLSLPAPGDLPNPGIEPESPGSPALTGRFFTAVPPGKPIIVLTDI